MSERDFKYIEKPGPNEIPSFRKSAAFSSLSSKIVDEFLSSGVEAPVKVKIPSDKDAKAMCRGIGKLFKRKKAIKYTARIDVNGQIWIVKR